MMGFQVKQSQHDLTDLARQLRKVGDAKAIRRELTSGLRKGTKPAVNAVKASALGLPSKGTRPPVLRARMARATSAQVRTTGRQAGVRVRVRRTTMGDKAALPRVTNEGSWRHPVFSRKVFVTQTSRRGWFDDANRYSAVPVRREIKNVLNDIERKMAHN